MVMALLRNLVMVSVLTCLAPAVHASGAVDNDSLQSQVELVMPAQKSSLSERARQSASSLRASLPAQGPTGPAPAGLLRLGDEGPGVAWLSQALFARGYLVVDPSASASPAPSSIVFPEQFDAGIEEALRAFQRDQGLKDDGVAGPAVYGALTADPTLLASALEGWADAIDAWSQQMRQAGYDRMVVVNIASYTLHAINLETNQVEIESRVIVGRPYTRTPRMLTRIVNLKANPDWSPPKSIRGARYQRPGPNNALGLMRFSTDNRMSIYLHDTNARQLFANDARALSHGCVRVQQWQPLAAWAARQDQQWVDEVALVGGRTRFLSVDPIPVLLVYSLADVVEDTPRQFADIYGLGAQALGAAALSGEQEPPAPLFEVKPFSGGTSASVSTAP